MAKRKNRPIIRVGAEADGLRRAGKIASDILQATGKLIEAGKTTAEIDLAAADLIADEGCESAFLGYRGFPGNICISMNEEVVHGIGGDRVIEEGDVVKIDIGITTPDGWVGDNAMSVPVGQIGDEANRLLYVTEESLYRAIDHAREGELLSNLCNSVNEYVSRFGYSVVKEFVGHGVGKNLHEEPQIPNYWDAEEMKKRRGFKNPRLQAGMVMAIEPMVNAGAAEIRILDDDWTVETADRSLSSHFEHTVLVTDSDPEILTPRPRLFSERPQFMDAAGISA
ncbi:MAG: type I methionyl aminopeptidase [Verrucomicrobiales bacterium]|nr:type I methionyl aminopeptidase [Verrucomicrobiales bacterium]